MLREAREAAGLTQERVANILGVSRSYICKLEKKVEPLTIEMAIRLARVYGVSPKGLL
jgi:transcriptional regulator with XRE-family HTH domain